MDLMELAAGDAILNLIATHPQHQQLPSRDDPVLPSREQGHRGVDRRSLCGYMPYKLRRSIHTRQRPTSRVTRGSRAASTQRKTCDESPSC
jgi:hypothetical protein